MSTIDWFLHISVSHEIYAPNVNRSSDAIRQINGIIIVSIGMIKERRGEPTL